jgi:hypothetical protein
MGYKILADLMVLFHFLWILFLFFGVFWGIRYKAVRLFHFFGLGFAFFIQLFNWYCPLTHLELYFRSKHDPISYYSGSFIIYYMERIIYLQVPQYLILIATIFLCALNLLLYLAYFRKGGAKKGISR